MLDTSEMNTPGSKIQPDMTVKRDWIVGAFILVILCAAYSSVFSAGFIWDDDAYVINNVHLRTLDGLFSIWFVPGATPQYYPMVFTLFWLQFQLWGLNPFGYHIVNIVFHGGNAFLVYQALKKLNIPAPLWIAAIFALHPVQVESVAWITELKNVLSTFFCLVSFLLYWHFSEGSAPSRQLSRLLYAASLFAFLLALLSKSVTGSLPAVILLLFWWKYGRCLWRDAVRLIPFFVCAVLLGWNTARLEVSHVLASGPEWDFTFIERVLIAGRAVWFYVGKLFWPYPLVFNYERWQIDASVWWQYLFPLGVLGIATALWLMRGKVGRGALAACLIYIGTLFPALGFFNVYPMRYSFVADHFQYAASISLITLAGTGVAWSVQRISRLPRTAEIVAFVPLLLLLGVATWHQGMIYQDRMTLFTDTIEKNPKSWLSYSNRGRDYALSGRDDLALADIEKSLAINPEDADALQIRGAIALKHRDFDRAIADMTRSVELYPGRGDYLRNRSLAFRNAGNMSRALADADRAIELAPEDYQGYINRASLYSMMHDYSSAEADLQILAGLGYPLSEDEHFRIMGLGTAGRSR